jgi:hypothetical protein
MNDEPTNKLTDQAREFLLKNEHDFGDWLALHKRISKARQVLSDFAQHVLEQQWVRVDSPADLPTEGKWWITWQDFYGERFVHLAEPESIEMWNLIDQNVAVGPHTIKAVMPYIKPQPFQEKQNAK